MPTTYEPIATTTLGSAAASITFSSIPATYTDLRLVGFHLGSTYGYNAIQFNGDTGTNYSTTHIRGSGTAAASGRETNVTYIDIEVNNGSTSTIPGLATIDIFSYAGSTFKTSLCTGSQDKNGDGSVYRTVGLWRSTSAITSVTFLNIGGNNFAAGTTATLYGIKNA